MRWLIILLAIFAFLQVSILSLHFDLIILVVLTFVTGSFSKRLLVTGFATGILLDLLSLTALGTQAVGILIALMVVRLSRLLFNGRSLTLGIVMVLVSLVMFKVVYGLLLRSPLDLFNFSLVPELVFATICYVLFQRTGNFFDSQEERQLSFFKA